MRFSLSFSLMILVFNYSCQIQVPISEDGVVKYTFDYSAKNPKFCVSKLFNPVNSSEYSILLQKAMGLSYLMSWNEGITKKMTVGCYLIPQCTKPLQCVDTCVLGPNSIRYTFKSNKKLTINDEEVVSNELSVTVNTKLIFKNKTDYSIIISDIYAGYAVMNKRNVVGKRIEIGALYNDKQLESKGDANRLLILELFDNAVKNTAKTLQQAIDETIIFLN